MTDHRSNVTWHRLLAGLLSTSFLSAGLRADWIELPASADTGMLEHLPEFNFGAQADVPAGTLGPNADQARSRMLLRFDVASRLPPGTAIEAAFLHLEVTREPLGAVNSRFALHRLLAPWFEGGQQGALPGGAPAATGEATWSQRQHGQVAWNEPGGQAGTDFDPLPAAFELIEGIAAYEFELGAKGIAEVQDWVDDATNNHGWILLSQAEHLAKTARRFATRESSRGPSLRLRYTLTPMPPRITGFDVQEGEMILRFWDQGGQGYVWEGTTAVPHGVWETVARLEPVAVSGERTARRRWPALPQQYFRLAVEPGRGN